MSGKLYICPTPIGNLEDMTYRTIRILNEVDLIAAEDTRHSLKLLNHFEISKPLRAVSADYGENQKAIVPVGDSGEVQTISNAFILSEADAQRVAQAAANLLSKRKTMSGEYRADPRLDALDTVQVESKYATNSVVITGIEYSTSGGGFRGKFTGRVLS